MTPLFFIVMVVLGLAIVGAVLFTWRDGLFRAHPEPQADEHGAPDVPPSLSGAVILRTPVYNNQEQVAAYHLHYWDASSRQEIAPNHRFCDALLGLLMTTNLTHALGSRKLVVPLPVGSFDPVKWLPLQSRNLVLLLDERHASNEQLSSLSAALKDKGFAVAASVEAMAMNPFLASVCSYALIDFSRHADHQMVENMMRQLRGKRVRVIALGIDEAQQFERAQALFCHYYEGALFARPRLLDMPSQVLPMQHMQKLMGLLHGDAGMDVIEEEISRDLSLVYRLLHFMNSPWFGFRSRIVSIHQAISLMGREKLAKWVAVAMLSCPSGLTAEQEESYRQTYGRALFRGTLMEQLVAVRHGEKAGQSAFITGLFSMLDVLLQRPLAEIMAELELPEVMRSALLDNSGPLAVYLALARAGETFNSQQVAQCLMQTGLSEEVFNEALLTALELAEEYGASA